MFSITGECDHTPFGGHGVQLVWGQRGDGELVHISKAERGRNCNCVCPACELDLVAKKGRKLAEHFSHQGGKACSGVRETNAHSWAKSVLQDRKEIYLPPVIGSAAGKRLQTYAGRLYRFERARLEKREGSIIPDVVLIDAKGRRLIVEILVTHACDELKIGKIRELGTPALEVDMGRFRRAESVETVVNALIGINPASRAPREWLYNPKIERAGELLTAKLARAAAERVATLDRRAQEVIRDAASIKIVSTETTLNDLTAVNDYDRSGLIDIPIPGARGFRVPAKLWQAAVLARVVIPAADEWATRIAVRWAWEEIQDCLAPAFKGEPASDLVAAVRRAQPSFLFPRAAIAKYLEHLAYRCVLERDGYETFRLADHERSYLRNRGARLAAQRRRAGAAQRRLHAILEQIPAEDRAAFRLESWLAQPIESFGVRLADLVENGDSRWEAFEAGLREIERMYQDGRPASLTLGLPLEAEIARVRERERAKQLEADRRKREADEKAALERVDSLSRRAIEVFGLERATKWLATILPSGEHSFLQLAQHSYEGFHQAHQALGDAHRELLERQRHDREAERCRAELRGKAIEVFGVERAEIFLLSTHPRLGMPPWAHCTDSAGLRDCMALMPVRASSGPSRRRA